METQFLPNDFDKSFRTILGDKYIFKSANWFVRGSNLLSQESNSPWETALSIDFLIQCIGSSTISKNYSEADINDVKRRVEAAVNWLINYQTDESEEALLENEFCWDWGIWDTSVVIRSLLYADYFFQSELSKSKKNKIKALSEKSYRWLMRRFSLWESGQISYAFGPADIAQVLATAVYIGKHESKIYEVINNEYKSSGKKNLCIEIVKYLDSVKHCKEVSNLQLENKGILNFPKDDETFKAYYWCDYFQTAETLEAYILYHGFIQNDTEDDIIEVKEIIEKNIYGAYRWIEIEQQANGMWGTHVDTIRILSAYVKCIGINTTKQNSILSPEPQVVFKALRWIIDKKQFFKDGSFLHTMFLSIFASHALMSVYKHWDLIDEKLCDIYDIVVWKLPSGSDDAKSKGLAAELFSNNISHKLYKINNSFKTYKNITLCVAVLILIFFAGILVLWFFDVMVISINDTKATFVLAALAIIIPSIISFIFFIKSNK